MDEFHVRYEYKKIPPDKKAKILSAVYSEILSWSDPGEKKTEPAVELSRHAAGSEGEKPAQTAEPS